MLEIRLNNGDTFAFDKQYYRCECKEKGISIFKEAALVAFFNFGVIDMFFVKEVV